MEVIRQRVKTLHEPVIQRQGVDRILVQLPGKDIDPARARDIFRPTRLEFKPVLAAAARQFPLHHPAVAAVIPGARTPGEVDQNLGLLRSAIPPALWRDLKTGGLVRPDAPTPG